LYNKTPPASPKDKMRIPKKRSLNELPEIKGLKNPASNAKKITK